MFQWAQHYLGICSILLLCTIYHCTEHHGSGEVDRHIEEEGLFEHKLVLRDLTKSPECSTTQCGSYEVHVNLTMNRPSCYTTYCVTVGTALNVTRIAHLDVLGPSIPAENFLNMDPGWYATSFSLARLIPSSGLRINQPYCFDLQGMYITSTSSIMLNIDGFSCEKQASIPSLKTSCAIDCVVDSNFGNAACKTCDADCAINSDSTALGLQTCTMNVLTSPNAVGLACNTLNSRSCTISCPVDCKYTGPIWKTCPANCANPTTAMTGYYYIATSSMNGGSPCNLPMPVTQDCSMASLDFYNSCVRNCEVTGVPSVNCMDACPIGYSTAVLTYSYPITVVSPTLNGSPCPTLTTTCSCSDCVLAATPTSIGTCDATCTAMDGSAATGLQFYAYPISIPAKNFKSCTTTTYRTCYKACPCAYVTSSTLAPCVLTTTYTMTTPWVATGYQKMTGFASIPKCNTVAELPCYSTLSPVHCTVSVDCPSCTCPTNLGAPYSNTLTYPCQQATLETPRYGGKACPMSNMTVSCNMLCPGCVYDATLCNCDYTATAAITSLTYLTGTKTCVLPPRDTTYSLCKAITTQFSESTCSTVQTEPPCETSWIGCDSLCTPTSTLTSQTPYTLLGYRQCSHTDTRPLSLLPTKCTKMGMSSVACSATLNPVHCNIQSICDSVKPSCDPKSTSASAVVTCSTFTLASPMYGGNSCTPVPLETKTYTTICAPTATPTECLDFAYHFNLVVYGNATAFHGSVCGRVAIESYASLMDYSIGKCLYFPLEICNDAICNTFIVGGNLTYYGTVSNGFTNVGGHCNSEIFSNCPIICQQKALTFGNKCEDRPFEFASNYTLFLKRSKGWARLASTANYTIDKDLLSVQWSGSAVEVLNMTLGAINGKMPIWNSYTGTLRVNSTVIINVYGTGTINFVQFSLDYFKPFASKVVWNFPEASRVIIDGMSMFGLIALPYGTITGTGTVQGSAFVQGMDIYGFSTSLTFRWIPYDGICFD